MSFTSEEQIRIKYDVLLVFILESTQLVLYGPSFTF